ncbi:heme exporter protein D [Yoonia tamlensis]|uniref:Heme exporter protein D n=1 Tax=Yoonia tamlensis TaxID=390270 RepID=A0A1I6GI79_9RHOB|nr:heme exporter protein CcmD [Yoonia tamlensis]SFR41905.1 heme exporter protein D [Yoonia tamlensis]
MPELGKYAVEVLAAYGVSLGLLAVIIVISWRRSVRVRAALERIEKNG